MAGEIEGSFEDIAPDGKLPGDVMVSILTNLPVKSLLRFKSVSKPWCSLISTSRFSKLHFHRQSLSASNCLLVLKEKQDWKCGLLDLSRDHNYTTDTEFDDYNPADDDLLILEFTPLLPPEKRHLDIIDSCNGLVLLASCLFDVSDLALWNPSTRRLKFIDLPKGLDLKFSNTGLCYVDALNDFKILVWKTSKLPVNTPNLYVYSSSSDSWDMFHYHNPRIDIHVMPPTFIGGCMHWLSNTCHNGDKCTCISASEVVAFDVTNGALSWFNLPENCRRHLSTLKQTLDIGGCLSIIILREDDVRERGFEVWVMEEYGVEGSWVKRFSIQEEEFEHFSFPFVSWIYGEIVVNSLYDDSKVVIFYDPYSEEKRYVEFSSYRVLATFNYVESLASLGN